VDQYNQGGKGKRRPEHDDDKNQQGTDRRSDVVSGPGHTRERGMEGRLRLGLRLERGNSGKIGTKEMTTGGGA